MSVRLLSVLATILAAGIGWQWSAAEAPPDDPVISLPDIPSVDPVARDTAEWARTVLARPLLQPGRRPPMVDQVAAPDSVPPRLTAVLSGPFGRRAIFSVSGGRSLTVQEGADADGWTVLSIGQAGVSVRGRDGELLLRLSSGGTVQAKVEPSAPAEVDEHDGGLLIRVPGTAR